MVLLDVGTVYISSKCRVGRTDLRQVVSWAGGDLVNTARVAQVVVGEFCHVGDSSTPHFVKVAINQIISSYATDQSHNSLKYRLINKEGGKVKA